MNTRTSIPWIGSLVLLVVSLSLPCAAGAQQQPDEFKARAAVEQRDAKIRELENMVQRLSIQLKEQQSREFITGATPGERTRESTNAAPPEPKQKPEESPNLWTPVGHSWIEIIFSCAVLLFGLVLVAIHGLLVLKGVISETTAFKLIGLTIVVIAGVFVIPAGFSQNQMTPLMGLLGAVAGYLLGKDTSEDQKTQPPDAPSNPGPKESGS